MRSNSFAYTAHYPGLQTGIFLAAVRSIVNPRAPSPGSRPQQLEEAEPRTAAKYSKQARSFWQFPWGFTFVSCTSFFLSILTCGLRDVGERMPRISVEENRNDSTRSVLVRRSNYFSSFRVAWAATQLAQQAEPNNEISQMVAGQRLRHSGNKIVSLLCRIVFAFSRL